MKTHRVLFALAVVVSVILAGCVPATPSPQNVADSATNTPTQSAPPAAPILPLNGTGWVLETLKGQPAMPAIQVTLNFEKDTLNGADGCNQYSGGYTVAGERITVAENLITTMMACEEPVMEQASAYLAALGQASTYAISGDKLTLLDADGNVLATFTQQNRELSGASWTVTGYNNGQQAVVGVLAGSTLTLNFANGQLSGSAGCNNYTATYEVSEQNLSIGPAASTRKWCAAPDGVMEQEAQFLQALETTATYHIDGDRLELRTGAGELVVVCARSAFEEDAGSAASPGLDPQNAAYVIEGQTITLRDGVAETEIAPGSASKLVTRYFGQAVDVDLNGDGALDSAFLLVQEGGGSGTFFYVAAALKTEAGYVGTNAIFLGDRIAPQNNIIDPDNPAQFIVNYADRKADEPMSAQPSQGVSRWFGLEAGVLVEVTSTTD